MIAELFVDEVDHDNVTLLFPRVAVGLPGIVGVPGVAGVETGDASDVPSPLCAFTVKVYEVPFVSVPTVQLGVDSVAGEQVIVPGDEVAV